MAIKYTVLVIALVLGACAAFQLPPGAGDNQFVFRNSADRILMIDMGTETYTIRGQSFNFTNCSDEKWHCIKGQFISVVAPKECSAVQSYKEFVMQRPAFVFAGFASRTDRITLRENSLSGPGVIYNFASGNVSAIVLEGADPENYFLAFPHNIFFSCD